MRVFLLMKASTYRASPFLEAADRLGIEVVKVVDTPEALSQVRSDLLGVDFKNLQTATQAIVSFAAERPAGAILAVDDAGSLLAAQASKALGLPHNAPEAAEAARNKYRMRSMLAPAGIPVPSFRRFTTANDPQAIATQVSFPCVVKPLQLSGSQGVIRANDPEELGAAISRLTRLLDSLDAGEEPKPFLVEAYIPGMEVALEGILDDGRLRTLALFDKPDPLVGPFFEETIYVTPSRLPAAIQRAVAECAAAAAQALGLRTGPVHAELRVNEDGPWLLEVAGRSIGGLCSQTLRFGVTASLEELILRQAVGLDTTTFERESQARGVMMIPIPAAGLLKGYRGVALAEAVRHVTEVTITAPLYHMLTPLPEGDSYLGFIFAEANTPAEAEAALREAHQYLTFDIEPVIQLMPV